MTSQGRRDCDSSASTLKAPHFFKIILSRCLQDRKLMIPRRFIRRYGEGLSNLAFLKLPNGAEWKLELTKCDGKVWLQKGWQEFIEYYSLKLGHLLVFRYEGNSHFYILVFDKSATEIDYPSSSSLGKGENLHGELLVSRMEQTGSDSHAQILDDFPTLPKTRKKSPLPSSRPHKMMRTNLSAKTASTSNLSRLVPHYQSKDAKVKKLKAQANLYPTKQELDGAKLVPTTKRCPKSKTLRMTRMLNVDEKARALQRASGFKTESPCFKVVLQPSYICRGCKMTVLGRFLGIKQSGQMVMLLVGGKSWLVKFRSYPHSSSVAFTRGWSTFVKDNSLQVGDVCAFELIKSDDAMLKVSIFRNLS
ncbi:hypothetical protein I3842_02G013200 [Carya illinoinensis]|uniref:TF-B3 domain-containing protein n=3 Tax=Carya illinoinensis TaxID=32201 RepID=A0A922FMK7_CARIL|nr:hypothetical protein I3842_02G013200 [Carya illinoinensis]